MSKYQKYIYYKMHCMEIFVDRKKVKIYGALFELLKSTQHNSTWGK